MGGRSLSRIRAKKPVILMVRGCGLGRMARFIVIESMLWDTSDLCFDRKLTGFKFEVCSVYAAAVIEFFAVQISSGCFIRSPGGTEEVRLLPFEPKSKARDIVLLKQP